MAVFRKFYVKLWIDSKILKLKPCEKFLYIFFITNTESSQCGIYKIPKELIKFETGYKDKKLDKVIDSLEKKGFIKFSKETDEVMIINWVKKNFVNSPNTIKCMNKELKDIDNKGFVIELYKICSKLGYPVDKIFKDITYVCDKTEQKSSTSNLNTDINKIIPVTYENTDISKNESKLSMPNSKTSNTPGITMLKNNAYNHTHNKSFSNIINKKYSQNTTNNKFSNNIEQPEFNNVINIFSQNIHPITPLEYEKLKDWCNDISPDIVEIAIKEAVDHNARSIGYINSILNNWLKMDLTTKDKVETYSREWKENKTKNKNKESYNEDYLCRANAAAYVYCD